MPTGHLSVLGSSRLSAFQLSLRQGGSLLRNAAYFSVNVEVGAGLRSDRRADELEAARAEVTASW